MISSEMEEDKRREEIMEERQDVGRRLVVHHLLTEANQCPSEHQARANISWTQSIRILDGLERVDSFDEELSFIFYISSCDNRNIDPSTQHSTPLKQRS